jgi:hypothetical protein
MATITAMYKGATLKADLVRIFCESNHPEEASRLLEKWRNKEIVEASCKATLRALGKPRRA